MEEKKLTLKEELAKSFEKKSQEKLKFIFSLLLSNLFVFILCFFFLSPNSNGDTQSNVDQSPYSVATGHELIILDVAQTLIDKNNLNKNQYVTILNENKNILVSKAKMISPVESSEREKNEFKFEISREDIAQLRDKLTEKVIVVPLLNPSTKEVKKQIARNLKRSKYEVPYQL
jgi:hypothetical protein